MTGGVGHEPAPFEARKVLDVHVPDRDTLLRVRRPRWVSREQLRSSHCPVKEARARACLDPYARGTHVEGIALNVSHRRARGQNELDSRATSAATPLEIESQHRSDCSLELPRDAVRRPSCTDGRLFVYNEPSPFRQDLRGPRNERRLSPAGPCG